ncbi:hypothetical protein PHLCEN_2v3717 [Hermanssonia centrifuga]|uniref:Cytochrome P450 n=1 Tax=Hermanssonia centrifuga TaxID=98765 RepID=A0A2R6QEC7_9APHY|nr:hypothetical protein PHLCEN_2v3717 [Hermanssonia centrifuga]
MDTHNAISYSSVPPWALVGLALLISTLTLVHGWRIRTKRLPVPPGPKPWPIIGNALQLPKEKEWLTYQDWSHEYGSDVLYFTSWGRSHVLINSAQAAAELLEKRSTLYSGRPRMPMLNELIGFEWDFAFMPYDDEWKDTRKAFTQHFRPTAAVKYRPIETQKTRELLRDLLETPQDFVELMRLLSGKIIMGLTYGIDVQKTDDPYVSAAQRALRGMNEAGNVGTYLVDFIPALKYVPEWFPGARFRREAREWRVDAEGMVSAPFNAVKSAVENGNAVPSMLHSMLEAVGEDTDSYRRRVIANAAAAAYEAIMRTVATDDIYKGYYIPNGSIVVVNSWAMLHDPVVYPDPDRFMPERFLTDKGELDPDVPEPAAAFGFGRRVCPGMYMASDSLWITAASLLWAFRIEKPKDRKNEGPDCTGEYTFGLVR